MLSKNICKVLASLLIPALSGQACSSTAPRSVGTDIEQVHSELTGSTTLLQVTDFKGKTFDGLVASSHLLEVADTQPGVVRYLADGKETQDPLSLFTAASSRIQTASGESVHVVRTGNWLQAAAQGKRVHWDAKTSTLSLISGDDSGSLTFPTELSPQQAEFVAAGLAHFYFGAGNEGDTDVQESWGAIIVILVIIIGGVLASQAMAQSCCERAAESCESQCAGDVESFSCSSGVDFDGSVDIGGFEIDLSSMCIPDCICAGDFGGTGAPGETEHPWP